MSKKFICPFCFTEHELSNIQFRCQNTDHDKCKLVEDKEYAKFRGMASMQMPRVFAAPTRNNVSEKGCQCPYCHEDSTNRVCPSCHNDLPYTIGKYPDLMFAFIGAKEAGKSHYISVLIDAIKNDIGKKFNASLQALDDNTTKKYRNEFYNPVFQNKEIIPETKSARTDYNSKMPLMYSLSFLKKNLFGREKISNVSTITFFDTAGEDLNAIDTMRTENKYIYNSQGIILLIDPLQIPEVRDQLKSTGIKLPNENADTEDIIGRVAKLIRQASGLTNIKKRIKIPIAVAFSKMDALNELLQDNPDLFSSGNHNGFYNLTDANSISTLIENCMNKWGGNALIRNVKSNFQTYSFFGISALGSNPDESKTIPKFRPTRVEDPFLWLLYKNDIIKNKKTNVKTVINLSTIVSFVILVCVAFFYLLPSKIQQPLQNAEAYYDMGDTYYNQKKYTKAIRSYQKAIDIDPNDAYAYHMMGIAYSEQKNYPQAINCYQKVIDIDPYDAVAFYNMGNAYSKQKNYPQAISSYQKAIDIDSNYADAYYNMWDAYFKMGNAYCAQNNYTQAINCYQKAIDINPNDVAAYNNMGNAYYEQKNYPQTIICYQKAIDINPNDVTAYNNMGNAYYKMGIAYYEQKNYLQAIICYQKAIDINPNNAVLYNNMGSAYSEQKNYPQAINCYQKAIDIDQNDAMAYNNMGSVYYAQKNYTQAISCYQKAIDIDQNYANAYYWMGNAHILMQGEGFMSQGISCYQKAARLGHTESQFFLSKHGLSW
ncbi:MAG: tetratricopeptide repeat protein [Tannerellaceae bacterium]|jgi:tetratricopeptide (TPR) repeat protein|nr:tetratricopeptide repeat protein [Tannerellaceae bacterium]